MEETLQKVLGSSGQLTSERTLRDESSTDGSVTRLFAANAHRGTGPAPGGPALTPSVATEKEESTLGETGTCTTQERVEDGT